MTAHPSDSADDKPALPANPADNIAAWAEHYRDRIRGACSDKGAIVLSGGDPGRVPFPPAVRTVEYNIGRDDIANRYWGAGPMYRIDAYTPYLQRLGIEKRLTHDNVTPGNGVTQLYCAAVKSLLKQDDVLLVPVPTYGFFLDVAKLAGKHAVPILLRPEDFLKLTPEYLDQEMTRINRELAVQGRPKISAFLNINPHNPTGAVYTKHELTELAGVLNKHGVRLVIDDMVYSGLEYVRAEESSHEEDAIAAPMSSVEGMFDKTVTMLGLSKSFSLTALRAAIAVGPAHLIQPIRRYIGKEVEFVSHASQVAISKTFSNDCAPERNEYLRNQARELSARLIVLSRMIKGMPRNLSLPPELFEALLAIVPIKLHNTGVGEVPALSLLKDDKQLDAFLPELMASPYFQQYVEKYSVLNDGSAAARLIQKFIKSQNDIEGRIKINRALYRHYCDAVRKHFARLMKPEVVEKMEADLEKSEANRHFYREELRKLLISGIDGLKLLSGVESGFFALLDATAFKGMHHDGQVIQTAADLVDYIAQESGVRTISGEAMGYYGERLMLRVSFSVEPEVLIRGMKGIKSALDKLRQEERSWQHDQHQKRQENISGSDLPAERQQIFADMEEQESSLRWQDRKQSKIPTSPHIRLR